ncbi:NRDE protein-domain-containing protein [Mycena leptocephala]|nr:NRDE protein-domain-containing protein [Mycena leptocephala]
MCVAFWTLDHPDYALILCANRDEYLARPALAAAFHSFDSDSNSSSPSDAHRVLSGRDTQSNGTWLGLTPSTGRVAVLTNITEPPQSLPSSRGALAPAFLLAEPRTPLDTLYPPDASYAGFNLLVLEAEWEASSSPPSQSAAATAAASLRVHFPHASLLSNGGAGGRIASRPLFPAERASGGLSNGLHVGGDGGDAWPKVVHGRALFAQAVKAHDEALRDADAALAGRLFALLRTTAAEPVRTREELRRTVCVRPLEIRAPPAHYATRTASVLLVRRSGEALFVERDVWRLKVGALGACSCTKVGRLAGWTSQCGNERMGTASGCFAYEWGWLRSLGRIYDMGKDGVLPWPVYSGV